MIDNEKARDLLAMIKVKEPGEFIVNSWWGSFVNDYREALQMAIEALEQQPCEDCRNCKKWNKCPCGKEGHENGTSIGYSIGECKNYEPCDDCISRQAVLDGFKKYENGSFAYGCVRDYINKLPSVTPKEKTGRWISFGIQGEIDGQIVRAFTCSKCGAISIFRVSNGNIVNGGLCPNCGAKMQEVENDTN